MARKKSDSSSTSRRSSSRSGQSAAIGVFIVVVIIVVGLIFGQDTAATLGQIVGINVSGTTEEAAAPTEATSPKTQPAQAGQPTSETAATPQLPTTGGSGGSSSGPFWTVYFTEPDLYENSTTSGGIELHLIDLINNAQSSIDLAVFEFNLQGVADALIAAHNRGVTVRIVHDDEHTADDPQMDQMIKAGIAAMPDKRSAFMHNKFFIIDRQLVWTGSWNVTTNDTFQNNNNAIVLRSQQIVENYQTEFNEMFEGSFGTTSPANTPNPEITINGIKVENYFASEDEVMPALIRFTSTAQKSIHFMAFSFTDYDLAKAMMDRGAAGAELIGIIERLGADTDAAECGTLRKAGFDARIDGNPRTFHHKVIIVDGIAVALGSFNWSNNAANNNDENLVIIYDPALAAQYEQEFQARWAETTLLEGDSCKK